MARLRSWQPQSAKAAWSLLASWPRHVLRGSYAGDPAVRFLLASSLSAKASDLSRLLRRGLVVSWWLVAVAEVGSAGLGLEDLLDLSSCSHAGAEASDVARITSSAWSLQQIGAHPHHAWKPLCHGALAVGGQLCSG